MDLRTALVAEAEPPVLVGSGSGQGPHHRRADLAPSRVVIEPLLRQDRLDPYLPQPLAMRLGVLGQSPRTASGLPRAASLGPGPPPL